MGDQLMELIKIFHKVELEGGQATLSATTLRARPSSSWRLCRLLLQPYYHPRHQLLVIVAVTVAQERGLAATSEQLPTKLRQPPVAGPSSPPPSLSTS